MGVNLTFHIRVVTSLRIFTAIHIPLNEFLARTETDLLTRKTKYIMDGEGVFSMTCITFKPYAK